MKANDVRSTDAVRHGAYVCLRVPPADRRAVASSDVDTLADRLGLRNEYEPGDDHPTDAVAFLRSVAATPADLEDDCLLRCDAIVHVASPSAGLVAAFRTELARLLGSATESRVLDGVVRPTSYTGNAMHNFAYAHRALQQSAIVMPEAFLVPMSKTSGWWDKDWMERHTYFLPRYDDAGQMLNQGHALAAEAGVACLMRRTYRSAEEPAAAGAYEFVNYFECATDDIPTFRAVHAALRDVAKNPEWKFVREGPTWHGRRVATWAELFA